MSMLIACSYCGQKSDKRVCDFKRAVDGGYALYCDRECAGLGRRCDKTAQQRKAEKADYDRAYRAAKDKEAVRAAKAEYYQRTRDPVKEAEIRKQNMARHVAYCQRPEYVAWKSAYDQRRRDRKAFGEFAEVAALLRDVEGEIEQRASRYEVYQQNGTLNKAQTRRRSL